MHEYITIDFFFFFWSKLKILQLKFGDVWILILHPKVSKFKIYHMKFRSVWILRSNISKFGFYPLTFRCI